MDSQGSGYYTSFIRDGVYPDDNYDVNNFSPVASNVNQPGDTSQVMFEAELARRQSKRSGSFTSEEYELLVSAWFNISMDPIQGKGQKSNKYWVRVHEYYHNHKTITTDRTSNSLLNRWSMIQQAVNKFCGCIAQINERRQSGINEQDKIEQAKLMYSKMYGSIFNLEHCWNKLKLAPKWLKASEKKKNKKPKKSTKSAPNGSASNAINVDEGNTEAQPTVSIERPPGTKGEKARVKQQKDKEAIDNRLVGLLEDMRQSNSRKLELMENLMAIQQKQAEDRIMDMDLSTMSSMQAEYYTRRHKGILDRMQ